LRINAVFGTGIAGKSLVVTAERRVNCYYENRPDKDKTPIAIYGTPGMKPYLTVGPVSSPVRGMIGATSYLYAVNAGNFYQVQATGVVSYTTTIGSSAGSVSLSASPSQVVMVDGHLGYIFTGGVLVPITSAGFPNGAKTVTNASGFFVAENPGTQQFFVSNAFDGTTWNALAFASASAYADVLLAVDSLIGNLVLFSSTHLEFWQNVGSTPQPFAPILSATAEYGIAAIFSRAHVDTSICFLAQVPQGGVTICQITGYAVQEISDPDLCAIINAPGFVVNDAVGMAYRADRHPMYQITFPTMGRSFLFDCLSRAWSETQSGLTTAYTQRHIGNFATLFNGVEVVSDYQTNQLYQADPTYFTDNLLTIPRLIITKHQLNDFNVFSVDEAYLDMETGVGLVSGQGSNPMVSLACSKDNGRTYLTERWKAFGQLGQYNANSQRAIWRRWGSARVFNFKVYMTDPVKFVLTNAASSSRVRPQQ
jgi:hypothetical protein